MRAYSLSHLSDASLLHDLARLVACDRDTTASLLAHIAEVDERKLYLPAGYSSMHAYCVDELHLSEDAASRRIQAARVARRVPALFGAIAVGDLSLTGVNLLAPHLTEGNATALISAATHKRKIEIEALLAARFPRPEFLAVGELVPLDRPIHGPGVDATDAQHALAHVHAANALPSHAPNSNSEHHSRLAPVAAERYLLHVPIDRATHDKLKHAAALLSHAVPSGDMAEVLDRALDALIERLEKRRFAATDRPRRARGRSGRPRSIPAHIKREVWRRDQGQCTFVGADGHRCASRRQLEFDHVEPVARGGRATATGLRLRCRAHNQFEAERIFGAEFMTRKRAQARERTAAHADAGTIAATMACLSRLGFRPDEIRHAMAVGPRAPGAALEQRIRAALEMLAPRARKFGPAHPAVAAPS